MVTTNDVTVTVVVPVRAGVAALGATEVICEALELVTETRHVSVIAIGDGAHAAAASLRDDGFADLEIFVSEAASFAPGTWAQHLAGALADTAVVLLPASADGRDLAPRIAALLGRPLVAGATNVTRQHSIVVRAAGRALVEYENVLPMIATLQPGVRSGSRVVRGEPSALELLEDAREPREVRDATVIEQIAPKPGTMELAEAPFLIGAGIGLGTKEVLDELEQVAQRLGASLGATRVVTDEGWHPHDAQIGTTGVVVNPDVYVAFGISGAVQHTAGLGSPLGVISVNTDAHCPMMQRADLAIVSDAPQVIDALRRKLGEESTSGDSQS